MKYQLVVLALFTLTLASAAAARCASWNPDPSLGDAGQHRRLYNIGRRWGDDHFDQAVGLVKRNVKKSGAHLIRESAYYAYGLLLTGDPADRQRAERIIRLVLAEQDLRVDQPTYGNFLPYFEDRWETLVNPDLNYGQFVGLALGHILDLDQRQQHMLSADLRRQLQTAFRLAVEATIRRDVEPGYTNIALLSAAVGAAGEKLLGIPGAGDFAMSKLTWILARAQPGTTLTEYLSPTYYGVDLQSAYAVQKFAASPELKTAADRILHVFWREIAAAYHAPTFQLAGPHSRAYGENMLEYAAGLKYFLFLALDGKYPLMDVETDHDWDCGVLTIVADLPVGVRPEFQAAQPAWREISVGGRTTGMLLRQFREGDFILGSISSQFVWQQQRNVVAYWPVAAPERHVAFCQDLSPTTFGNGYAHFYAAQSGGAVLAALTGKRPPPQKGGLCLGFNGEAQARELAGAPAGSWEVHDGGITAHVYPVSRTSGRMTFRSEGKRAYLERPWASADPAGDFTVLAYLLVFQLPGKATPVVKSLAIDVAQRKMTVSATVDGNPISLVGSR
jgi:hypothetical protein